MKSLSVVDHFDRRQFLIAVLIAAVTKIKNSKKIKILLRERRERERERFSTFPQNFPKIKITHTYFKSHL